MIHQRYKVALTLLADGTICRWMPNTEPEIMCRDTVSVMKVCSDTLTVAALTTDGRFLIAFREAEVLEDRTTYVRQILGCDSSDILKDLYIYDCSIAINTDSKLSIIRMPPGMDTVVNDITELETSVYRIPSSINLISFDNGHGFLRTDDNCLYSMGSNWPYRLGTLYQPEAYKKLWMPNFDHTSSISEIVCGSTFSLFLMKNGCVYSESTAIGGPGHKCDGDYCLLKFPEGVRIAKIAVRYMLLMFVSICGQCYYINLLHDRARVKPKGFIPVKLDALAGYFVENLFVCDEFIFVLHDGGKVCLLWLDLPGRTRQRLSPNQDGIISLQFFDDKCVVSITQMDSLLYFVTSDGSVYYSNLDTIDFEPYKIPFFDSNPIAIENHALGIRSALSVLNHKD